MNRTKLMAMVILTLSLAAGACGGDGDATGPAAPPPPARTGTITLLNESSTDVTMVQFSRCSDESWGSNRLGASEHLAPNAMRHWAVEPGCYDLKASNGSKSASWFDREVMAGDTVRLAVPAELSAMVAPSNPGRAIAELKGR